MKKILVSCLALATVLVSSVSAMAAKYDINENKVTGVSAESVLIQKADTGDIVYVNEDAAEFLLKANPAAGTYRMSVLRNGSVDSVNFFIGSAADFVNLAENKVTLTKKNADDGKVYFVGTTDKAINTIVLTDGSKALLAAPRTSISGGSAVNVAISVENATDGLAVYTTSTTLGGSVE